MKRILVLIVLAIILASFAPAGAQDGSSLQSVTECLMSVSEWQAVTWYASQESDNTIYTPAPGDYDAYDLHHYTEQGEASENPAYLTMLAGLQGVNAWQGDEYEAGNYWLFDGVPFPDDMTFITTIGIYGRNDMDYLEVWGSPQYPDVVIIWAVETRVKTGLITIDGNDGWYTSGEILRLHDIGVLDGPLNNGLSHYAHHSCGMFRVEVDANVRALVGDYAEWLRE